MIRFHRTIHDVLSAWGMSQRALPPRADALKEEILSRITFTVQTESVAPWRLPWLSFELAVAAVIIFILSPSWSVSRPTGFAPFTKKQSAVEELYDSAKGRVMLPVSPAIPERGSITDTREFMKTDYQARLRTREIATAWQRAQTLVRGMGGRVDSANISEHSAYIDFAIPVDKLDGFRNELRTIVPLARFFTENISSQNLLSEKRAIESQSDKIISRLAGFRSERSALTNAHRGIVSKIQSQLAALSAELTKLRSIKTDNAAEQIKNAARKQELIKEENALRVRLKKENSSYNSKVSILNSQIGDAENQANRLSEQDQDLRDTVATVVGTVAIERINVWQIIGLYLPGSWLSWFLLATAIVIYLYHRRRNQLVLP